MRCAVSLLLLRVAVVFAVSGRHQSELAVHELQASDPIGGAIGATIVNLVEGIVNGLTVQVNDALHEFVPASLDLSNHSGLSFTESGSPTCILPNPFGSNCLCESSASFEATVTGIEGLNTFTLVPNVSMSLATGHAITWPWNVSVTVNADAGASVGACGLNIHTPDGTIGQPLDLTGHATLNVTVHVDGNAVCVRVTGLSAVVDTVTFEDPIVHVQILGIPADLTGLFQNFHWQDLTSNFETPVREGLTSATNSLAPQLVTMINQQLANISNISSGCGGNAENAAASSSLLDR